MKLPSWLDGRALLFALAVLTVLVGLAVGRPDLVERGIALIPGEAPAQDSDADTDGVR